jgi:hypothetical protein
MAQLESQALASVMLSRNTVAAGFDHTCVITAAGGARCWGGNLYGQARHLVTAVFLLLSCPLLSLLQLAIAVVPVKNSGTRARLPLVRAENEIVCVLCFGSWETAQTSTSTGIRRPALIC